MTKSIRHFTLVELLTVVVVMTILGSITIPLYNRLMTGSAVSYANRLVNSQLNMARVHACRKRKNVAVLFADYSLNYNNNAVPEEMAQRAFRCAYVIAGATPGTWEFSDWVEGSKWEFLPRGAFFTYPNVSGIDVSSDQTKAAVHNLATSEKSGQGLYPIQSSGVSVSKVTDDGSNPFFSSNADFKFAVIFTGNGRPVEVDNPTYKSPKVRIAEGIISTVDKTTGVVVVKYNPFNYMISTVNRYTGMVSSKAPEID